MYNQYIFQQEYSMQLEIFTYNDLNETLRKILFPKQNFSRQVFFVVDIKTFISRNTTIKFKMKKENKVSQGEANIVKVLNNNEN